MNPDSSVPENTDAPAMDFPAPTPEHAWLERFVGEWESEAEICCQPDTPPMKYSGTERARMLGGFWLVAEGRSAMDGSPFANILTLGYDPQKTRYVGTWIDSMTSHMWQYEGTVNAAGTTLSLDTDGPSPMAPEKRARFREVTEFLSPDHRVFTSSIEEETGEWRVVVTVNFRRKR